MANQKRNTSTQRPEPRYPFPTTLNEQGQTVFFVPIEAPRDRTANTPVNNESKCTNLYFKEGAPKRVRFIATTDQRVAFDQRRWLNSLHTQERRMAMRQVSLEGTTKDEDGEPVPRDEHPLLADTEDGYIRAEFSDLPGLITEYIGKRYPKNPLYREVYKRLTEEMAPKDISTELGIDQQMVYYYQKIVHGLAKEYKKRFIDND